MTQALYAPWPETARRTWGWGALGLMVAGYFVSSVPVVIGTVIYTIALTAASGAAGWMAAQSALSANTLTVMLPLMLLQFIAWGVMTLLWVKLFEKRPLSTIGLSGRDFAGRADKQVLGAQTSQLRFVIAEERAGALVFIQDVTGFRINQETGRVRAIEHGAIALLAIAQILLPLTGRILGVDLNCDSFSLILAQRSITPCSCNSTP